MLLLALLACVEGSAVTLEPRCDPRSLEAGEVRVRELLCTDELVAGGEGRLGDWLLENAGARFVVRGTYASLYALGEDGGSLIDAAGVGSVDLLAELRPDVDRSSVEAVTGEGWVELRLPGATWHLDADRAAMELRAPASGDTPAEEEPGGFAATILGIPASARTGASWLYGDVWMGVDGEIGGEGPFTVEGVSRVALTPAERWPGGEDVAGAVDADVVRVEVDGELVTRLPVSGGRFEARVPGGAHLRGEREGCGYDGLVPGLCGSFTVLVRDETGLRIPATLADAQSRWVLRTGGEPVELAPSARRMEVYAGPAFSIAQIYYGGLVDHAEVTLQREMDTVGATLARLDLPAWPTGETASWSALHQAVGEGAGMAVVVAQDEVPVYGRYTHDLIEGQAGSEAAGLLWSWPWSGSTKRHAHGAVPWEGLSALDLLTVSTGTMADARLVVARPRWVALATAEAPPWAWPDQPDAVWLDSLADLPTYLGLLDAWLDVAPVGPYTWVETLDDNLPGMEAGILNARTTAGNGPRVRIALDEQAPAATMVVATVDAPRWMGNLTLTLHTSGWRRSVPLDGERVVRVQLPRAERWIVATVEGRVTRPPWLTSPAWAVSGPLWLEEPGG